MWEKCINNSCSHREGGEKEEGGGGGESFWCNGTPEIVISSWCAHTHTHTR